MRPEAWLLLGTVVTALAALVRVWMLIRQQGRQSRTTDAQQIIDQLQEERTASREEHRREIGEVRSELDALRKRVQRMESRELAFFDYVSALRWHIEQGKGPPPPPWPPALMNRTPTGDT